MTTLFPRSGIATDAPFRQRSWNLAWKEVDTILSAPCLARTDQPELTRGLSDANNKVDTPCAAIMPPTRQHMVKTL